MNEVSTISTGMKASVGVLVTAWSLVSQQALAATIYAVISSHTGRLRYFPDYIQEYLLWRLREPTWAVSRVELIANVSAAVVVLVFVLAAWRWVA